MVLGLSYGELFVTLGIISVILGALSLVICMLLQAASLMRSQQHSKLVSKRCIVSLCLQHACLARGPGVASTGRACLLMLNVQLQSYGGV